MCKVKVSILYPFFFNIVQGSLRIVFHLLWYITSDSYLEGLWYRKENVFDSTLNPWV